MVYLCSVPTDRDAGECVPGGSLTRHALEGFQRRAAADAHRPAAARHAASPAGASVAGVSRDRLKSATAVR